MKFVDLLVCHHFVKGRKPQIRDIIIHAVCGFPQTKYNPTFVLLMKGRPLKRRRHPPHKEGPPPKKEESLQVPPTGTEELKSTTSIDIIIINFRSNAFFIFTLIALD